MNQKSLSAALQGVLEAESILQEGRAASILDHSNICTVFDVGETEDGSLFMAMAFIDGRPLSRLPPS